jgi:hypothetical protein
MLHNLQRAFIEDIFTTSEGIAEGVSEDGFLSPAQRLQIYKNNTRLALIELLMQSFPAVTKLVDEKFMRYAAQEFWTQHPPTSGDMNDYGADFPTFLQNFPALSQHLYIADVAQLEWLRHEAWLSPVLPSPSAVNGALYLQPHVRLMHSRWPVASLWAFALDGGSPPSIDAGESFVLVHRTEINQVVVRRLDKSTHALLSGLQEGHTIDMQADAKEFLNECLAENIFTGERQ